MAETKAPALALKVSSGTLDVEKLGAEVIVSSTTDLSETPSIGNRVGDGNTDYLIHGKRLALLCVYVSLSHNVLCVVLIRFGSSVARLSSPSG